MSLIALRRWFAACLGIAVAAANPLFAEAAACDKQIFRIVLDVGHTLSAPGAISARGATEFTFNQRLAAVIERRLAAHGYRNILRMITAGGLLERTQRANSFGADLFLSVHHDSVQPQYFESWNYEGQERFFSDRFKGWSLFVSYANAHLAESLRFATFLGDRLLARGLPFTTHHAEAIKGEGKRFIDATRGIYRYDGLVVLRSTNAPAVLMESGVIVNRGEEVALASAERQNAIAEAVAEAVDAYCDAGK